MLAALAFIGAMTKAFIIIAVVALIALCFGQYKYEQSYYVRIASFNGCIEDGDFPDNLFWGGVMCTYARVNMSRYVNIEPLHASNLYWAVEGMINGEHHDQELYARSTAAIYKLLSHGQDINQSNECGETILHAPIVAKSPRTVAFLLASGADPNYDVRTKECDVIRDRSPLELSKALIEQRPEDYVYSHIYNQLKANK